MAFSISKSTRGPAISPRPSARPSRSATSITSLGRSPASAVRCTARFGEEGGEERIRPLRLQAAWVLPMDAAPLREAAVLIGGDGRIAAVGPAAAVPAPPDAEHLTFPSGLLLPG